MPPNLSVKRNVVDASIAIGGALVCASPASVAGYAVSAPGRIVDRGVIDFNLKKEDSISLFGDKAQTLSALAEVADAASEDNWDGYGALPLFPEGIELAKKFIRVMPEGLSMPIPCPEPDGEVALEWYGAKNQIFSLSFGKGDRLAYALMDGTSHSKGVEQFNGGVIDPLLLEFIRRVT